jgi:hypothetical protein
MQPAQDDRALSPSDYPTVWLQGAELPNQDGELWFAASDSELPTVTAMLRELLWFPAWAVITGLPGRVRLVDHAPLDYAVLRTMVSRAELVLCGAWDASNYLLWTPLR